MASKTFSSGSPYPSGLFYFAHPLKIGILPNNSARIIAWNVKAKTINLEEYIGEKSLSPWDKQIFLEYRKH